MSARPRLIVGVTGSSAPQLGYELLRALAEADAVETHLVLSRGARETVSLEMDADPAELEALADVVHDAGDLAAPISSGSFHTLGMVGIPWPRTTEDLLRHTAGKVLDQFGLEHALFERWTGPLR